MSAPVAASPLVWHDETEVLGIGVQVHFFDADEVGARPLFTQRCLPVFGGDALPTLVAGEEHRPIFSVGDVWAQPDAVFEHGDGLLCLSHRATARRGMDRQRWRRELRADTVLQALAVTMVVAGARQRPAAALLRMHDALLMLAPQPQVLECLATSVAAARRYWSAPRAVSAVQLARYCEPLLRSTPGVREPVPAAPRELPVE